MDTKHDPGTVAIVEALGRIEREAQKTNARLDELREESRTTNERLAELRTEMNVGFGAVNERFDGLNERLDKVLDESREELMQVLPHVTAKAPGTLADRMDRAEAKIAELEAVVLKPTG